MRWVLSLIQRRRGMIILLSLFDLLSDRMLANTVIEDWSYELEETEETGIGDISNDNAGTSKHSIFDA